VSNSGGTADLLRYRRRCLFSFTEYRQQSTYSNSLANNPNILINSAIANVVITGNVFLINNNSSGINMAAYSTTAITGNTFEPNTGSPSNVFGVVMSGWAIGGSIITGNNFFNLTAGITLQSTSKNVNVQCNVYNCNVTNTSDGGTGNMIGGGSP
jgi:nitrous oxidase accessory protein NosD